MTDYITISNSVVASSLRGCGAEARSTTVYDLAAAFAKSFQGELVTTASPAYADCIKRWAANAERKARVIAFVKTPQDVALALRYAKETGMEVAVCGGGHSIAAASSCEGLVIDLSRYFNGVTIDSTAMEATVGGGALWKSVDEEAIKHGLATVAGTINHIGVAGSTLGGGFGWLTGKHGLVIDNLVKAEIVTANGTVLIASPSSHADLFWGIRGAGANFGVVTSFVFKLHRQRPTVYAGMLSYPPQALEQVVDALSQWWEAGPSEDEGIFEMMTKTSSGPAIVLQVFYNGSEVDGRAAFKKFFDIGVDTDSTGEIPYEQVNALQNTHAPHGASAFFTGGAQAKPSFAAHKAAMDYLTEAWATHAWLEGTLVFDYLPLGKVCSVPAAETPFHRSANSNILSMSRWTEDSETDRAEIAEKIASDVMKILQGHEEMTQQESMGYANYDPVVRTINGDSQAKVLFGANYAKLQMLKAVYDPEMTFNKFLPITPA
jgi:FAD/FMN-containing dehydrogenase